MDPETNRPSEAFDSKHFTTNAGTPVSDNQNSLSVGSRGPLLLEDYHLLEKLAQFDRERIPERVVHARGVAAKGYFETTADISSLSCADVFRGVGVRTPIAARLSTVIHSRHSPETLRDPRGFSVKFYTREGNWDLVGNNMPVFFVRDGIKFPDLIHSLKPNPRTEMQEWWRILDFLSHHPESLHVLTWLLDDVGIPKSYRHMPGFGVHTFRLLNAEGKSTYVKFHWIPKCGDVALLDDDAKKVTGEDWLNATHDLINAIDDGDFPEWTLCIQTMDPAKEFDYDFDPLDASKIWPESEFPLQEVGRMVLDRNVDNHFLENEQIAFSPSLIVPGIYFSDDKLLQSRLFSYADTQRYRIGANYLQLPINAPRNEHRDGHHDGAMNTMHRHKEVNYHPSRFDDLQHAKEFPTPQDEPSGQRVKQPIEKQNDFKQPGDRFRSFDAERQDRFVNRVAEKLNGPRVTPEIKKIWLDWWAQCDENLGKRLADMVKVDC
eukprot:CAMPEP_0185829916 /NCGR_PEP_ID=MMETSP1353-20130828/523_1 /TAXON_ID=1077150 /ORGANISM="Erythrolobus australicus, Strain CCMP3124" /LENGTH=490 /DNA_ID=CAMNT_0028527757 /DNA_START=13 /DNA_END=1485 /DNA_ORIENTATION=+